MLSNWLPPPGLLAPTTPPFDALFLASFVHP